MVLPWSLSPFPPYCRIKATHYHCNTAFFQKLFPHYRGNYRSIPRVVVTESLSSANVVLDETDCEGSIDNDDDMSSDDDPETRKLDSDVSWFTEWLNVCVWFTEWMLNSWWVCSVPVSTSFHSVVFSANLCHPHQFIINLELNAHRSLMLL